MRYANHECAGCGLILPANELTKVSDRVETGTSQHQRYSKTYSNYQTSGRTRHYATRVKRLCRACRRKRTRNGFIGLCGGVALILFLMHGGSPKSHHSKASWGRSSPTAVEPARTTGNDPPAAITQDQQLSRDDSGPAQIEDDADRTRQIVDAPQDVERVNRAIQKAGTSGVAARWHVHGLHGYAVPSAPSDDGCRMVQVSIDGGEQAQPTRWCPDTLAASDQ